jgi:hypothetical protein
MTFFGLAFASSFGRGDYLRYCNLLAQQELGWPIKFGTYPWKFTMLSLLTKHVILATVSTNSILLFPLIFLKNDFSEHCATSVPKPYSSCFSPFHTAALSKCS